MQLTKSAPMNELQFKKLCSMVYNLCGINLTKGKEQLVHSRLQKRLNELNLDSFENYFKYLDNDRKGSEVVWMLDALTTNKTSFFREIQHFDFLRERVLPNFKGKGCRIYTQTIRAGNFARNDLSNNGS